MLIVILSPLDRSGDCSTGLTALSYTRRRMLKNSFFFPRSGTYSLTKRSKPIGGKGWAGLSGKAELFRNNTSRARLSEMDIERTMEFILEQLARVDGQVAQLVDVQRRHQEMTASLLDTVKVHEDRFALFFDTLKDHHERIAALTDQVDDLGQGRP